MIGTWRDTILNLVVFVYVGWLIRLWLRPARGPLVPAARARDAPEDGPADEPGSFAGSGGG
jgi:hypothetical protein